MNEQLTTKITNLLQEKNANLPCERCNHSDFFLLNEILPFDLTDKYQPASPTIITQRMPCIVFICNNCGNVKFHSIGALGLLNEDFT